LRHEAKERSNSADRLSLQSLGDQLDKDTKHRWIYDEFLRQTQLLPPECPVVIDNIRNFPQLEFFRLDHNLNTVHVHLYASIEILEKRFHERTAERKSESASTYSEADILKRDSDVDFFKKDADVRIYTTRTDAADNLVRVAARLGHYSPPSVQLVDVVVGGQYGSEGKGHICAYLARNYDVLVRVGGPNAGHTVSSPSGVHTYHHLPSGTRDVDAEILLGPGMTINVKRLLDEIEECKLTADRLFIDPQVMIIEDEDIKKEQELVAQIASTGRGGGAAAARRILGRRPSAIRLARDIPELAPYVGVKPKFRGSTYARLEIAYSKGYSILLEGTQGSGLSIYHGPHPHVTSRDTNVAGCLAEAGISPSRVRKILMVIRPTPIRVGDPDLKQGETKDPSRTSGPLKHETTFKEVAEESGLNPEEVVCAEITSTTKRPRRVGWFEWDQYRQACGLNAPTDIVLTFADYIDCDNQHARRFEQLSEDTIKFIEELERIAQAPVSLINTRFPREPSQEIDLRTVIDRRNWTSERHR
jgi:adenylosuccinate synthase